MWERWTSAWEGRLHVQLSGAGVSQQERGGSSLTGFELFVGAEFPKSGNFESPHLEYLNIPCVLGQILEKIASGM